MNSKISPLTLKEKKRSGKKIVALTAYDCMTARILDAAGVDIVLVGDSLGMVLLGYRNTLAVTIEDMLHYTRAVSRGVERALLVGDMPFMSYHISLKETVRNAGRFVQEARAEAVKLEGGVEVCEKVRAIVAAGIPVLGHIGLKPQDALKLGGYKVQGKDKAAAERIMQDARALEDAGVFGIVMECVPAALAKAVTESLSVPTIGIGAGKYCDGQVVVTHDILGLTEGHSPKFVKRYADLRPEITRAVAEYKTEVEKGIYPDEKYSY
ncbi:MAG TPA: 3-methyl-2-oxobutanoate hydroxymethyltransferase [bacterium]|nr:3-methyl-2-oxobutanoate hydroxymethyltransferase [bacterium]